MNNVHSFVEGRLKELESAQLISLPDSRVEKFLESEFDRFSSAEVDGLGYSMEREKKYSSVD